VLPLSPFHLSRSSTMGHDPTQYHSEIMGSTIKSLTIYDATFSEFLTLSLTPFFASPMDQNLLTEPASHFQ